jgi:DNA adenine methylase
MVKPLLKWVGGKTQILDKLFEHFPTTINNYHEIFLGGGSVLFALLLSGRIKGSAYAYDSNEPLIYMYKNVQTKKEELYTKIVTLINEFYTCPDEGVVNRKPTIKSEALQTKENYYYWCRAEYNALSAENKKTPHGSALFIFLNKTCFRGVFRVGPNGFNVPYGHYKNPEIINRDHLDQVHWLIKHVQFECLDYSISLKRVKPGDYVYLDPPYAPETTTSFVGYTESGFSMDRHTQLFNMLHNLNASFMMSNSDVEIVKQHFPREKYKIYTIVCKRSINSKNPDSKTNEVIILSL